jgi:hypothetical protein
MDEGDPPPPGAISGDCWDGSMSHSWVITDATERDVVDAVRRLDQSAFTEIAITGDHGACLMIAGGGEHFVVTELVDDETFWTAVRPGAGDATIAMVAGGQEGEYDARLIVPHADAVTAALAYRRDRNRAPSLTWEQD